MFCFAEMAFPRAIGLTFCDGAGNETLVLIRNNKFVEPRGGWEKRDRVYFVKETEPQAQAASDDRECPLQTATCTTPLNLYRASFKV